MNPPKRVAVLQSSYIPWKGYFDIIHDVDTFIFYDDVQFTYQDWRSRNRIIANGMPLWLTVPTGSDIKRLINEVKLPNPSWQRKHWSTLRHAYTKSPHFKQFAHVIEELYLGREWTSLSEMNQHLTRVIAQEILGINVEFRSSTEFLLSGSKLERLVDLVRQSGATHYLSGPAARAYIDPAAFEAIGVALQYKDYSGYPEYRQQNENFEHAVSVLDLIFNVGESATEFIWGWRNQS
ncbi:WbqC family protein [Xanthomonas floridensis]|uniref:WbqC family protein n=1 Tax=Xanthomonas floridensis TaxID=1843580 RepID=A0A1A9M7W7_9XANT|nr:WbqC family protein [Xanthomonas floridensis]MEA5122815.1 WbqC family protein [Xanthomonas floridensis]MEA5131144.1 WbqC family protein [Xanthomonas floridensis]OAG66328.1 hypothetical protein A7D17_05250 [Xanthomonas floridensis]